MEETVILGGLHRMVRKCLFRGWFWVGSKWYDRRKKHYFQWWNMEEELSEGRGQRGKGKDRNGGRSRGGQQGRQCMTPQRAEGVQTAAASGPWQEETGWRDREKELLITHSPERMMMSLKWGNYGQGRRGDWAEDNNWKSSLQMTMWTQVNQPRFHSTHEKHTGWHLSPLGSEGLKPQRWIHSL